MLVDYPDFYLEDKVPFEGERDDSNSSAIKEDQRAIVVGASLTTGVCVESGSPESEGPSPRARQRRAPLWLRDYER